MHTTQTATGITLIQAHREPTAVKSYQATQANIAVLLAALHDRLAAHAERAAHEPTSWGYAGDLGAIQERLTEAVDFLRPVA